MTQQPERSLLGIVSPVVALPDKDRGRLVVDGSVVIGWGVWRFMPEVALEVRRGPDSPLLRPGSRVSGPGFPITLLHGDTLELRVNADDGLVVRIRDSGLCSTIGPIVEVVWEPDEGEPESDLLPSLAQGA